MANKATKLTWLQGYKGKMANKAGIRALLPTVVFKALL